MRNKISIILIILAIVVVGGVLLHSAKPAATSSNGTYLQSQDASVSAVKPVTCDPHTADKQSCSDLETATILYSVQNNPDKQHASVTAKTGTYKVGQKITNLYYYSNLPGQFELR